MDMKYTKLVLVLLALASSGVVQASTEWSVQDYDLYPGDFDGDAKTDLLYVAKDPGKLSGIASSDGSGPSTVWQSWVGNYLNIDWSRNQYQPVVADFNGDGKADIFLQRTTPGDSYLLLTDERGHVVGISQTISNNAFGLIWSADQHRILSGDFTGDGKADLFLQATNASGTNALIAVSANGQFSAGPIQTWLDSEFGFNWSTQNSNAYVGDFNADGKADLLVQAKPRWVMIDYDVTFPVPTYPPNKNGIIFSAGGVTPFQLANVQQWGRTANNIDWSPLTYNLVLGDFVNGDGRTDILFQPRYGGNTYLLAANTGSGAAFPANASTVSSGTSMTGDSTRLIAGKFTSSGTVGLYYQSLIASGNNYVSGAVASAGTGHNYSSTAANFLVPSLPPGQANAAGRTVGMFDVSAIGGAVYSLPIWMPAGPRGIQPNIAITYDGGAVGSVFSTTGILGLSMGLSGLTSIERCVSWPGMGGATGWSVDSYCLGNSRLRLTGGSYAADGSTYKTEVNDSSLITAHGYEGGRWINPAPEDTNYWYQLGGPQSFTIQDKNGLTYEYGTTSNAREMWGEEWGWSGSDVSVKKWYLNKVSDKNGNNYIINYTPVSHTDGGGTVTRTRAPVTISYVPNNYGAATYKYTINFDYEHLVYAVTINGGASISHDVTMLAGIKIKSGAQTIRRYALSYDLAANGQKRLTSIQECADDTAGNCFQSTNFSRIGAAYQAGNLTNVSSDANLIGSIVDGYGMVISPTYQYTTFINSLGAYSASMLVSQFTAMDGAGATYTKTYTYDGGKYDSERKQLTFDSITVVDSRDALVQRTTYANGQNPQWQYPHTGMVVQQDIFQSNGTTPISKTSFTPAVLMIDNSAYNQRYFRYVSSKTAQLYEVGGVKDGQLITTETTAYGAPDVHGNFSTVTVTTTDNDGDSPYVGQSWSVTTANTYSPDTSGNWCVGLPTQTTVTRTAPNGVPAIARTIALANDYVKCRTTQEVLEPTSPTYKITENYEFDAFGNVKTTTTTGIGIADSRVTRTDWGTTGQFPIATTNALNQTTTYGYDYDRGTRTRITDPNNLSTYFVYDGFQRKVSESRPDGTGTAWSYTDCRVNNSCFNTNQRLQVYQRTVGVGAVTLSDQYVFLDQFDRPIVTRHKLLDGSYSQNETKYNSRGLVQRESAPCSASNCAAYWTDYAYDTVGRLTQTSRPKSASDNTLQTTTVFYLGRLTEQIDPMSKHTKLLTNVVGNLARAQDHNNYYQSFAYDAFGSLLTVTDRDAVNLFTATYDYGVRAYQRTVQDVDLGSRIYGYNAFGEQVSWSDGKGQNFLATYDALSRPLSRTEPDAATQWTWGGDANAHNIGVLKTARTVAEGLTYQEDYEYDAVGRSAKMTITVPGAGTAVYDYGYSASSGLLDTLTYPATTAAYRLKLQYGYQNGILSQVSDFNGSTVFWRANNMNARGQITNETLGNGVITSRIFDQVTGWLSTVNSGPVGNLTSVQNASYLQDLVGNVTQRQDNTLGLTENFYYDDVHRLKQSTLQNAAGTVTNLTMTYRDNGNIDSRSDVAGGATWTYDPVHKHAVTQAGSSAFTYHYDANGNADNRNGNVINWTSYNYPKQINSVAGETISFRYGPDRQRWQSTYVAATGATAETTYRLGGLLEQVVNGASTDYRHYIYGGGARVAIYSRTSAGANTLRYVLEDHQGSTDKILDAGGAVQYGESFTAFGARRNAGTWSGAVSNTELVNTDAVTRQGYTGHETFGKAGLIHMNGRVQDATTGRFLSADPYITEPGNTQNYNRYSYVLNNPLRYRDPGGFWSCEIFIKIPVPFRRDYNTGKTDLPEQIVSAVEIPDFGRCTWDEGDFPTAAPAVVIGDVGAPTKDGVPQTQNPPCVLSGPTGQYTTAAGVDARFNPETSQMLSTALANLNQQGITPVITSGYRSPETQTALRNSNSPTVITPAQVSWHQVGAAVDFGPNSNAGNFNAIRTAMGQAGFVWGGNFRTPDTPHFQSQPAGTSPSAALVQSCARAGG